VLAEGATDIFKQFFSIGNIAKTYQEKVATNDFRGIDRIGRYQFECTKDRHFEIIHRKCLNGTYKYSPFAEKLKLRGRNRKPRVISIPTMRDRIVLSLLKDYLHTVFSECVNRKLPNTYIKEIKDYFAVNSHPDICCYKVDIESFYDRIKHSRLMEIISQKIVSRSELLLIKRAIQTPSVPIGYNRNLLEEEKKKNTLGVPQGLAISNILANIYMYPTDGKFEGNCMKYFRYVDDMLFIVKKAEEEEIKSVVKEELDNIYLTINENKTLFFYATDQFDYLGYNFRLPIVSVKRATVENYLRSLSALFSLYLVKSHFAPSKSRKVIRDIFISDVNEKITGAISKNRRYGWIFYFLEINDLSLLYGIDKIIRDKFCDRINEQTTRLEILKSCKKLSKTYYCAKYDLLGGYIHNYDVYDTIPKKIKFLVSKGIIKSSERSRYLPEEIERLFTKTVSKRLSSLEADVGETS